MTTAWEQLRAKCVANGMPTTYSDAEAQVWMSVMMAVRSKIDGADALPDQTDREIARMKELAKTVIDTTDELETLLDAFNDRGAFSEIEADDGTPFEDVPDFCVRELGLTREFVEEFLIDDEADELVRPGEQVGQ